MTNQHHDSVSELRQKAEASMRSQDLPAAKIAYEALCQRVPEDHEAWLGLGIVNASQGDYTAAEQAFQRALSLQPDFPQAHFNLGRLAGLREQWVEAEKHQRAVLALQPGNLRVYLELGVSLEQQGRLLEAEQTYRQALSLDDSRAELHTALSRVLREQGRLGEAVAPIERALQLQPDFPLAQLEMGHLLRRQRKYEVALQHYQRFSQLAPQERLVFLANYGGVLAELERGEESLACYDEIVRLHPQSADAHLSCAQQLLVLGRFEEGWEEYEWRLRWPKWQQDNSAGYYTLQPLWQGEPLKDKRLLVYAEQGFGDAIQFSRYLPLLAQQGAEVHFHCHSDLCKLFADFPGTVEVVARDVDKAAALGFDYCLPLMSLAHRFKTRGDNIPADIPYLQADSERQSVWRERLSSDGFKVGLVWAGAGGNIKDQRRSMQLPDLAALTQVKGVSWFSLQKGTPAQQLAHNSAGLAITDLGAEIKDFSDTAAIITNLDLVITVDTAVAHLAGALGCPAWVFIYNGPDWRWQLGRDDSPWYPSLRLFRQSPGEAWPAVVEQVAVALGDKLAEQQS
jgi:tetratricopeptide (TPR) repeat protein